MTLTEIRAALDSRGLRPLKQLGQNFLHDQNLARWLADHAVTGLETGAKVVEIGPGLGALTSVLLGKNLHLIALEKDRGLCVFLREHFGPEIARGSLDLREGDALEMLPRLGVTPAVICGNLPYYISTPLLMECLRLPGRQACQAHRHGFFSSFRRKLGSAWPACRETRPTARFRFWCRRAMTWPWSAHYPARSFIRHPKSSRSRCN